jgi:hypothetical protein
MALDITYARVFGRKRQNFGKPYEAAAPNFSYLIFPEAGDLAWAGDNLVKLELDDQERRAVAKSLVERKARLIESTEDTTQPRAVQRAGLFELSAIASVLRKLRFSKPAPK